MKTLRTLEWTCAIVPALIVAAVTAHAGQPGDANNLFPTRNPCSLLSSADVGVATGEAVNEGVILFRSGSTTSCSFARAGGPRIAVFIRRLPDGEWAAEQIDRMRRGVSLGSYREIEGVGERAFLLDRKSAAVMCVFENPYYLQISVLGGDGPKKSEVAEKLARMALGRLTSVIAKNRVIAARRTAEAAR